MANFQPRCAATLVRWRWPLALIATAILAIAIPLSWQLEMDRTIDQMFAADDPTLLAYQELQAAFDGNAAILFVYRDPELMTKEGLERSANVSARIAKVSGVNGVMSVAQLNDLLGVIRPGGLLTGLSSTTPPLLRDDDIVAVALERLFSGYTHSDQGDQSAVVALLKPADSQNGHQAAVDALRKISQTLPAGASDAVLVGEPVLLSDGFNLIERDGARLAIWTIAILSPLVFILLRGPRFVLLQVIVIGWAVTVTRAALYAAGMRLSLVSSILTAICTVIAVTSVIHLGSAWRRRRARGDDVPAAYRRSFSLVMPSIFWACATDAAGFLSLIVSKIAPIRDFALMMGIASIAVWVAMLLVSPIIMTVGGTRSKATSGAPSRWLRMLENKIRRGSVRLATLMINHRGKVLMVSLILGLITLTGLNRLRIESSFLNNFQDDSQIAASYDRVESTFKGAGVWDVVLDAPTELTNSYLSQVRDLENELRELSVDGQQLTKVLSIADVDRILMTIGLLRVAPPTLRLGGMRTAVPSFADALLVPAEEPNRKLRIMLRSREHLPTETKMALISAVESTVRKHTSSPEWQANFGDDKSAQTGRVTGYYVMLARLVSQIIGDQWRCLAWASAMVWLLLIAATRSLRLATLALVPNLLPVLAVLGALGWLGDEMNMGAAMIAAVSVGLSIDGSVHYLAGFQRKISRGRNSRDAAIYAQRGVGLPVVLATIALVIGFMGLGRSEFVPTATFGVLTAAALLAGTVVNLTLLPVLVTLAGPRKSAYE